MLAAMLGGIISVFFVWPLSPTWGFTFTFTFTLFFLASVYNFTHSPDENMLAVHEPSRHLKHLRQNK